MNWKPYSKEFAKNLEIAYPVMIGQLGHVFVGLADNIMVGKLGPAALAAISLANGVIFIALSLGIGFTFGITPLVAEADGENDTEKGRSYFQHGLLLSLVLGIFLFIGLLFLQPIMNLMNQPEEVVELAIPYFKVVAASMVPLLLFQGMKQFSDGLSLTKFPMQANILANILNVLLNYLLIYGIWIFPRLEVTGAAIGTLVSRIFMVIFLVMIFKTRKHFKPFIPLLKVSDFKKETFIRIFKLGYPTALQMFFEVSVFSLAIFLAGILGTNPQAANQIALNLASMTFMIAVGLGVTATVRVGNQKGQKNYRELRRIAISILLLMILIDAGFALIFVLTKDYLPLFYIDNQEVLAEAAMLIVIAGLFQLSDGLQAVILGALRGMQDVIKPMFITFVAYWVVGAPICYFLGVKTDLGTIGIWIGLLLALSVSAGLLFWRFNKLTKALIREKDDHLL